MKMQQLREDLGVVLKFQPRRLPLHLSTKSKQGISNPASQREQNPTRPTGFAPASKVVYKLLEVEPNKKNALR